MSFPKNIILCGLLLIVCITASAQSVSFIGDYKYKAENKAGTWVLKLNADSTYKWYFTEAKDSHHGHWRYGKDEIILFEDSAATNVKFKVIMAEDSERPVLYRKKCFYFKQ